MSAVTHNVGDPVKFWGYPPVQPVPGIPYLPSIILAPPIPVYQPVFPQQSPTWQQTNAWPPEPQKSENELLLEQLRLLTETVTRLVQLLAAEKLSKFYQVNSAPSIKG